MLLWFCYIYDTVIIDSNNNNNSNAEKEIIFREKVNAATYSHVKKSDKYNREELQIWAYAVSTKTKAKCRNSVWNAKHTPLMLP